MITTVKKRRNHEKTHIISGSNLYETADEMLHFGNIHNPLSFIVAWQVPENKKAIYPHALKA